jgi:hypothetical protein
MTFSFDEIWPFLSVRLSEQGMLVRAESDDSAQNHMNRRLFI